MPPCAGSSKPVPAAPTAKPPRLSLFLTLAALVAVAANAQQIRGADNWEVLDVCRLVTNTVVDGDSFRVTHKDREYLFRLYFVDAPETDPTLRDRVVDQAAYFGVSIEDIPRAGKLAGQLTREKLSAGPFTVITRWQNAMGRSSLARYYAVVLADGKNLAEDLVRGGLARIYGLRANWPDGPRSATFINQLKNLELEAREQKRGIWDEARFPRTRSPAGVTTNQTHLGGASAVAQFSPLDVNAATYEELLGLPGIGPVLAQRIIAHRPYQKVEDLLKVPGIGTKTLERLTPLVRVEAVKP